MMKTIKFAFLKICGLNTVYLWIKIQPPPPSKIQTFIKHPRIEIIYIGQTLAAVTMNICCLSEYHSILCFYAFFYVNLENYSSASLGYANMIQYHGYAYPMFYRDLSCKAILLSDFWNGSCTHLVIRIRFFFSIDVQNLKTKAVVNSSGLRLIVLTFKPWRVPKLNVTLDVIHVMQYFIVSVSNLKSTWHTFNPAVG